MISITNIPVIIAMCPNKVDFTVKYIGNCAVKDQGLLEWEVCSLLKSGGIEGLHNEAALPDI